MGHLSYGRAVRATERFWVVCLTEKEKKTIAPSLLKKRGKRGGVCAAELSFLAAHRAAFQSQASDAGADPVCFDPDLASWREWNVKSV